MSDVVLVAMIAAVGGGGLTFLGNILINRRNTSGTVQTSEAASLWAESNALRAEYKQRAEKLEERLQEVNNQLSEVLKQLGDMKGDIIGKESKIKELQRIIAELREENQRLLALKRDDI